MISYFCSGSASC